MEEDLSTRDGRVGGLHFFGAWRGEGRGGGYRTIFNVLNVLILFFH
jgi:hypothetical protein